MTEYTDYCMKMRKYNTQFIKNLVGHNLFAQMALVEPEFFNHDFVVTKLIEKYETSEQKVNRDGEYTTILTPVVIASTSEQYKLRQELPAVDKLTEIIGNDCNLLSLHKHKRMRSRGNFSHPNAPHDSLALAEVYPDQKEFGEPEVFFAHDVLYNYLKSHKNVLSKGRLNKSQYLSAMSYFTNASFGFIKGDPSKPRPFLFFDNGWQLKSIEKPI